MPRTKTIEKTSSCGGICTFIDMCTCVVHRFSLLGHTKQPPATKLLSFFLLTFSQKLAHHQIRVSFGRVQGDEKLGAANRTVEG